MMSDQVNIFNLYMENAAAPESHPERDANGTVFWRLPDSRLHRIGAPAIEYSNGHKEWRQYNQLHREDGPAIEYEDGYKSWWLHGKKYADANAWAQAVLKMHNKPHAADDVQRFLRVILTKEDLL